MAACVATLTKPLSERVKATRNELLVFVSEAQQAVGQKQAMEGAAFYRRSSCLCMKVMLLTSCWFFQLEWIFLGLSPSFIHPPLESRAWSCYSFAIVRYGQKMTSP